MFFSDLAYLSMFLWQLSTIRREVRSLLFKRVILCC